MSEYTDVLAESINKKTQLLAEATALLHEAVDKYPTESDPKLWTSRVREFLKKLDTPKHQQ